MREIKSGGQWKQALAPWRLGAYRLTWSHSQHGEIKSGGQWKQALAPWRLGDPRWWCLLKIVEFETLENCREWLDLDGHCLVLIGTLIRSLASSCKHDDDDVEYEITVTSSPPTRLCRGIFSTKQRSPLLDVLARMWGWERWQSVGLYWNAAKRHILMI